MKKRYDLHHGICKACNEPYFGLGKDYCSKSCVNSGRIRSVETRRKIAKAFTGRKLSPEAIEKRSAKIIGSKRTVETKKKISDSHIGDKNPMWGRKLSVEHKKKIGDSERGERHHNWKGGITPEMTRIRLSPRYRLWRKDVFKKDNYTCQAKCSVRGGELNADHIKPFSLIIKEEEIKTLSDISPGSQLWDVNNGRTLCIKHHKETETYGVKSNK